MASHINSVGVSSSSCRDHSLEIPEAPSLSAFTTSTAITISYPSTASSSPYTSRPASSTAVRYLSTTSSTPQPYHTPSLTTAVSVHSAGYLSITALNPPGSLTSSTLISSSPYSIGDIPPTTSSSSHSHYTSSDKEAHPLGVPEDSYVPALASSSTTTAYPSTSTASSSPYTSRSASSAARYRLSVTSSTPQPYHTPSTTTTTAVSVHSAGYLSIAALNLPPTRISSTLASSSHSLSHIPTTSLSPHPSHGSSTLTSSNSVANASDITLIPKPVPANLSLTASSSSPKPCTIHSLDKDVLSIIFTMALEAIFEWQLVCKKWHNNLPIIDLPATNNSLSVSRPVTKVYPNIFIFYHLNNSALTFGLDSLKYAISEAVNTYPDINKSLGLASISSKNDKKDPASPTSQQSKEVSRQNFVVANNALFAAKEPICAKRISFIRNFIRNEHDSFNLTHEHHRWLASIPLYEPPSCCPSIDSCLQPIPGRSIIDLAHRIQQANFLGMALQISAHGWIVQESERTVASWRAFLSYVKDHFKDLSYYYSMVHKIFRKTAKSADITPQHHSLPIKNKSQEAGLNEKKHCKTSDKNNLTDIEQVHSPSSNKPLEPTFMVDSLRKVLYEGTLMRPGLSLTELPSFFCTFQEMRIIDLVNCRLLFLPKNLSELKNLNTLRAPNNRFPRLDRIILKIKSLTTLDLSNNPFSTPYFPAEDTNLLQQHLPRLTLLNNARVPWYTGT